MRAVERVIDPGPIAYRDIVVYGDPDLEHGLRHAGFDPEQTTYRLVEIPLGAIGDTRSMETWKHANPNYVSAMRDGADFPPIVVMQVRDGWTLIDGVNRTYAAWKLRRAQMTAYELLNGSRLL